PNLASEGRCSMDLRLTSDQTQWRQRALEFAQRRLRPQVGAATERPSVAELLMEIGRAGFLAIDVPARYGGRGDGLLSLCLVLQELSRADASVALAVWAHAALCSRHLLAAASDEQKSRWLPRLASGELIGTWTSVASPAALAPDPACVRAVAAEDGWCL